jgi:hypothetical protein
MITLTYAEAILIGFGLFWAGVIFGGILLSLAIFKARGY